MKRAILTFCLLLIPTSTVFADDSFGLVLDVRGAGFSVYRTGARTLYTAEDLADGPIVLEANDLVQTEIDTFIDVQLIPSASRVRIAAFTTVSLTPAADGTLGVDVVYGRLLVDAEAPVSATSHGTTARSPDAGATFGVDFVAERAVGSIPVSLVYVTNGSVTLGPERGEGVRVFDGDMVRAARIRGEDGSVELVLETDAVDLEILDFWVDNSFAAEALTAEEIVSRYPSLRPRIADWLGAPRIATPAEPVEPPPDEDAPAPRRAETPAPSREEVLDGAIPEALRPEIGTVDYTGAKRFFRGTALTSMTVGLIAEGLGLMLYFAGSQVAPQLNPESTNLIAVGLVVGGGAGFGTGLISYIISNVLGSGSQ